MANTMEKREMGFHGIEESNLEDKHNYKKKMRSQAEEEEEEEEEEGGGGGGVGNMVSVEKMFECKVVPSWRKQLTVRAFVVSFVLGILFSFIVMKLNLTTGIIPSLNVSAGLLGFFFVKTWTKFLDKSGLLKQPFTRQENTVIQTCVVASSGIAFSGIPGVFFNWGLFISKRKHGQKSLSMNLDLKNSTSTNGLVT